MHNTLRGKIICLHPLTPEHAAPLWLCADSGLFEYLANRPAEWSFEAFMVYFEGVLNRPDSTPMVIELLDSQQFVGITGFIDIRPAHRGLEIGATWITPPYQRTLVNAESKYLLLRFAFDEWYAERVQFKTDIRNLQSQRAIEKLGATREGVLRHHLIVSEVHVRDSVLYSIIRPEWPHIKVQLEARLQYTPQDILETGLDTSSQEDIIIA